MAEQHSQGPAPFGKAPPGSAQDNPRVDHEDRDVNVRAIMIFLTVLVISGFVIHVVLWWMQAAFVEREQEAQPPLPSPAAEERLRLPRDVKGIPAPRLQVSDIGELEELHRAQNARLNGYGWVDPKAGIVHIPIDRAMDLLTSPDSKGAFPVREQKPLPKGRSK